MSESVPPRPVLKRVAGVAAVLVAGVVILLLTNATQGACYDSATDAEASYCTSGPVMGVAGVWVLWGLWGLMVAFVAYGFFRRPVGGRRGENAKAPG